MTACKQTASTGAAATYEADSKSAAKRDGAEERKPSTKCRLAVKSNGREKPKTHDLSDVTRGLAVMSIAMEKPLDEQLAQHALFIYQNYFWMDNFKGVYDKPSVDAIKRKAAENWKSFSDSDKAPYVAIAHVNRILLAEAYEFKKTLKLTLAMTDKMMNMKM
ncbi:HMG1/2-like protein isoform X2 [Triticum urartu]|uniref:HMG1/2-like protein isoform X2 n=1 Tax=Triticum urartu TaxID=4572 RepID=UPI002042D5D0|nr:HMG1/2-like protein isoform X2 [Triticum urartu]